MRKMKTILILIFVCFAMLGQQNVQAVPYDANVYINPSSATVSAGDTLDVTIETEILSMNLYGGWIGLKYNPSILNYDNSRVATDPLFQSWAEFNDPFCITVDGDNPCTELVVAEFAPPNPVSGESLLVMNFLLPPINDGVPAGWSGSLAILPFYAVGSGTSSISIAFAEFIDSNGNLLNVNVVPEPSTLLLLGSGLIAALGVKRFKKNA